MNYRNLFDAESKLMRGKNRDGRFMVPFSPLKWGDAFTEGNSWHYSWSVFHDPQGLIDLMGGKEPFVQMLDSVFAVPPIYDESYYGGVIHEIREMTVMNMGNYAHGNQPIQHMIYLYNYAGEPWKAQYWLRQVMDRMYSPTPDGYCGDEDNGQTSAWYVFSALGFYPVCPGTTQYVLGSTVIQASDPTLRKRQDVGDRCAREQRRASLCPFDEVERSELYEELHRPQRDDEGRHYGDRDGYPAQRTAGVSVRRIFRTPSRTKNVRSTMAFVRFIREKEQVF